MLVDKQIKERCEAEAEALISPFDENHVKSISYDLDIEGYINKDGSLSKERVCLHPGESVMIKTIQSLKMPTDLVGIIGERNSKIRQGLEVVGPHYFPGHTTAIYLRVTNVSPLDIELQQGDGIAQIFFEKLSEEPEVSYADQEGASFNNETAYLGYGKYQAAYEKQMHNIANATNKLENLESTMYGNILTLMGIFVSVFSLIMVNFSNIKNIEPSMLIKINVSLACIICLFMGLILFFLNTSKKESKRMKLVFIVVMIAVLVTMVLTAIFL